MSRVLNMPNFRILLNVDDSKNPSFSRELAVPCGFIWRVIIWQEQRLEILVQSHGSPAADDEFDYLGRQF